MVQLAAMLGSGVGEIRKFPVAQQRLIVASGAAAGLAGAYNAPLAGALFVIEIALGSVLATRVAPLFIAAAVAVSIDRLFLGGLPLYPTDARIDFKAWNAAGVALVCGAVAGFLAIPYMRGLRLGRKVMGKWPFPLPVRLGLGGLVVGMLAIWIPEVGGNGHYVLQHIMAGDWGIRLAILVLVSKYIATVATFGSGAVGGVFTPTLVFGALLGWIIGLATGLGAVIGVPPEIIAATGMASFLAATTRAPIMAMTMALELTLDPDVVLPVMLGTVIACLISYASKEPALYQVPTK